MPTTQISQRFIADGAINDAKVQAGAAIATSKLALNGTITLKDGSVAFTGNQSMGGNLLTNVGTPSASTDAATKSYVDTAISNLSNLFDSKGSVRAASVANVTLSNPGTAVFDGVTLTSGDRLFLRVQTATAENGIYVFSGSGSALTRAVDMDAWSEIPGALFAVEEGATYADTIWLCTANSGGTLGTTSIPFQQIPTSAGLAASNFVDKETPSGTINGSNTAFTLAFTPVSGSEYLFLNGLLLESGAGNDYTITGAAITMLTAPLTGEKLRVSYRK
jgi:hypothetical protein